MPVAIAHGLNGRGFFITVSGTIHCIMLFAVCQAKKATPCVFAHGAAFGGFHHGQCLWFKAIHGCYIIHFSASVVNGKMYENRASFARSAAERQAATLPEPKAYYT